MGEIRTLFTLSDDDYLSLISKFTAYIQEQFELRGSRGVMLYIDSSPQSFLTAWLVSEALREHENILGYISTEDPSTLSSSVQIAEMFCDHYTTFDPVTTGDILSSSSLSLVLPLSGGLSEDDLYPDYDEEQTFDPTRALSKLFLHSRETLLQYLYIGSVSLTELILSLDVKMGPIVGTINPICSLFSDIEVACMADALLPLENPPTLTARETIRAFSDIYSTPMARIESQIISSLSGRDTLIKFRTPLGKMLQRVSGPSRTSLNIPMPWKIDALPAPPSARG